MAKKKFSYSKLAQQLPDIMSFSLNQLGNKINKAIQDGVQSGKDINGAKFAPLSPVSKKLRKKGGPPLNVTGNMRQTKKIPATKKKHSFIIKMDAKKGKNKRKVQYGAYHNQGYTNSPNSAFPGTKVPKREWFGIPKNMKPPNGKEFNKFVETFEAKIKRAVEL
tara:strand:- start:1529 stop:2020 length:492 start_codon:yes stop_codon:yes gene_type:complete